MAEAPPPGSRWRFAPLLVDEPSEEVDEESLSIVCELRCDGGRESGGGGVARSGGCEAAFDARREEVPEVSRAKGAV